MTRVRISLAGSIGVVSEEDVHVQDVPIPAWTAARNIRFSERGAQQFLGHTKIFDTTDAVGNPFPALWIKYYPERKFPRWVYGDNNRVFCYENLTVAEITRYTAVPGDRNYNAVDRWQGTFFNGIGILNNAGDAPQQWGPISGATRLADLSNWPANYLCRFIKPFKAFLVAGNIYDGAVSHPHRLLWSNEADPGTVPNSWDITDTTKDAGDMEVTQTPDALVDGGQMGEIFIAYRENSTWAVSLTGASSIMRQNSISESTGLIWKDCFTDLPQGHVAAGWEDFYLHQGSRASFQSLLDLRDRKFLSKNRNQDFYYNCFNVICEPEKEIWHCFPQVGATYATLALVWNWSTGSVGFRDLNSVPFADAGPVMI